VEQQKKHLLVACPLQPPLGSQWKGGLCLLLLLLLCVLTHFPFLLLLLQLVWVYSLRQTTCALLLLIDALL
jgi:hypothetical protein